jgi:excisionase family DNA binding protein
LLRHITGWPGKILGMNATHLIVPTAHQRPTMNLWPEVGEILGLSKASVYAAAASGEIPTIRVGRRILVPTAALRRLLSLDAELTGRTPLDAA